MQGKNVLKFKNSTKQIKSQQILNVNVPKYLFGGNYHVGSRCYKYAILLLDSVGNHFRIQNDFAGAGKK